MVSASRLRTFFSWHSNNISTKHLPICQPTSTSHLGVSRNRQMSPKLGFILVDHFYGASFPYLDRQNPSGWGVVSTVKKSAAVEESSMGQQIPAWYGWGGSVNTDKSRRRPSSRSWSDSNNWTLGLHCDLQAWNWYTLIHILLTWPLLVWKCGLFFDIHVII